MNGLFRAARQLQEFCDARGWRSCFIGGLAVQRWGQPRLTVDVDLTLLAGFGNEAAFVDPLLAAYEGRIPDARYFALRHRVLLLRSAGGAGIDISLGALPFEESGAARDHCVVRSGDGTADLLGRTPHRVEVVRLAAFGLGTMPREWQSARRASSIGPTWKNNCVRCPR